MKVECLDCGEYFDKDEIELDGADDEHCPFCESTNLMDDDNIE